MKVSILFALILVICVCYTSAQSNCRGRPRNQVCNRPRDVGSSGRGCARRTMWYYDARSRRCLAMPYRGCRGNGNRYCSRADCERKCRRR